MKDSRTDPMLVGTVNLGEYEFQEGVFGKVHFGKGLGDCKIYVYSNEGPIPHFHLISESNNFEACICIFEPIYFDHGSKTGTLNSNQRKLLNEWMSSVITDYGVNATNWQMLIFAWRMNNGDKYIPKNPKQPDYTQMKNFKSGSRY